MAINKQTRSRRDPHPYRAAGQEVAPWSPLRDQAQLMRSLRGWNVHGWHLCWMHCNFWTFVGRHRLLESSLPSLSSKQFGPPQAMHRYYLQEVMPVLERYVLPLGEAVNGAEAYLMASPQDEGVIWPADIDAQSDFPSQWCQLVERLHVPVTLQESGDIYEFLWREYVHRSFVVDTFYVWFEFYAKVIGILATVLVKWEVGKNISGDEAQISKALAAIKVAWQMLFALARVHPTRLLVNRDFPSKRERKLAWECGLGAPPMMGG